MKRFDINDVVIVEHEGRPILKGSVNKVSCKPVMVEGTEVCPFNLLNGQLQILPVAHSCHHCLHGMMLRENEVSLIDTGICSRLNQYTYI
jgi:hypothetical protein